MKLNARTLHEIRFPAGADPRSTFAVWEEIHRGAWLGCRVYPSGRKVFVLKYRAAGRQRMTSLGDAAALNVHEAHRKAAAILAAIERDEPGAAEHATLAELAALYFRRHAETRWKPHRVRDERWRFARYAVQSPQYRPAWLRTKPLAPRRLRDIRRADIAELIDAVRRNSIYEANRVRRLLHAMFARAPDYGLMGETRNPVSGVALYPERRRDRWLSPQEIGRLGPLLAQAPPRHRTFFWLALLTGARRNELARLRWTDVDAAAGVAYLPETKNGRPRHLLLPRAAIGLLHELPRRPDNPHVFGGKPGEHELPMRDAQKRWSAIRGLAGLPDVTIHDLRRTYASWLSNSGVSEEWIAFLLGHSNSCVTAIYARKQLEQMRPQIEAVAEAMIRCANGRSIPDEAILHFGAIPAGTN